MFYPNFGCRNSGERLRCFGIHPWYLSSIRNSRLLESKSGGPRKFSGSDLPNAFRSSRLDKVTVTSPGFETSFPLTSTSQVLALVVHLEATGPLQDAENLSSRIVSTTEVRNWHYEPLMPPSCHMYQKVTEPRS